MNVVKNDGMYKTARISGTKHNYLALAVTTIAPIKIDVRPRVIHECETSDIDESKLLAAVSEGVEDGNRDTGRTLSVDCLEYVPTDTPDYKVYKELARAIIRSASQDFG